MSPATRALAHAFDTGTLAARRAFFLRAEDPPFAEIDAEFCLAEGGSVLRRGGKVQYASVQTTEKIPNRLRLVARGVAGHEGLGDVAGILEPTVADERHTGGATGERGVVDRGHLRHADSRHDAGRADRAWANADLDCIRPRFHQS